MSETLVCRHLTDPRSKAKRERRRSIGALGLCCVEREPAQLVDPCQRVSLGEMRPLQMRAQVRLAPIHVIGVEAAAMGKIGRGSRSPLSPTFVLRERLRDGPLHNDEGVWSFECPWRDTSSLWAEHSL